MKTIVLLDQRFDPKSPVLSHTMKMARKEGAQIYALLLVRSSLETADFIETQERQIQKVTEKASEFAKTIKTYFENRGVKCTAQVVRFEPEAFYLTLKKIMPADLIVANGVELPTEETDYTLENIYQLTEHFNCPVLTERDIAKKGDMIQLKHLKKIATFAPLAAAIYYLVFSNIGMQDPHTPFQAFLTSGRLVSALFILALIPTVAFIYGSLWESVLRLIRFD